MKLNLENFIEELKNEIIQEIKKDLKNTLIEEIKTEIIEELRNEQIDNKHVSKELSIEERRKIYQKRWRQGKGRSYHKEYMSRPENKLKYKKKKNT